MFQHDTFFVISDIASTFAAEKKHIRLENGAVRLHWCSWLASDNHRIVEFNENINLELTPDHRNHMLTKITCEVTSMIWVIAWTITVAIGHTRVTSQTFSCHVLEHTSLAWSLLIYFCVWPCTFTEIRCIYIIFNKQFAIHFSLKQRVSFLISQPEIAILLSLPYTR